MGMLRHGELRTWAVVLVSAAVVVGVGAFVGLPVLRDVVMVLNEGMTLKAAALWSFAITVVLFIVFAIAAGDSLIGELQFMLAGFFAFFVVIMLLMAWVF